jgi:putative nucleotidyltransferase with HDIG domain
MFLKNFDHSDKKNRFLSVGLTFIFSTLLFASLVLPLSFRPSTSLLKVGDVAFQDIRSPRKFSYISENLTDQAQQEAEKSVTPVYLPADPSISRKQLEKLKNILQYINAVQSDSFSSDEEKIIDLIAIDDLQISDENASLIIDLAVENWDSIQTESLYLLEQIMRSSIREDQVTIVQRNISPQISFDFNETETDIIKELVSQLIVANSLFSNDLTNQAIQEAHQLVEPVTRHYASGEIIVNTGQVINQLQWEALQELGYTEPRNRLVDYISAGFLIMALMSFNILYLRRIRQTTGHSVEGLTILAVVFLIFLFIARLSLPNHVILPYMFPIAAFGMMISSLYNFELGLILTLSLSILSAYGHPNMSDLAWFYFLTSGVSILILGRGRRTTTFFLSGLGSTVIGSLVVISNRLINSFLDFSGAGTLIGATLINGFGSVSLTLILQYLLAQILGKTTALQLMDLSRPDHPLLQNLLRNAPGTYQHCLQVANLAEQAAREINADALLTRVGALYHDIGKSNNPAFFIENQLPSNVNTHDDMDPIIASATIVQHVEDGIDMARKYRIPPQIKAFISEHHGSMITRYQYEHALENLNEQASNEGLDVGLFKYPGQPPQSKETALVMLADGSEARVRAESPESLDGVTKIIDETITNYENEGQLNFTELTKNDLRIIRKSFSRTLQNTYHHRIKYPQNHQKSRGE